MRQICRIARYSKRSYPKSYSSGFCATTAVMLAASGCMAMSLMTLGSVIAYADAIDRYVGRVQRRLDDSACVDATKLIRAKDIFASGKTYLADFNCVINL